MNNILAEREHPLLNGLIMKNILSYSDNEDLANHRVVCRAWFEQTLKRWRSTKTLSVVQKTSVANSIRPRRQNVKYGPKDPGPSTSIVSTGITSPKGVSLEELKKKFEHDPDFLQLESKPFSRYRLKQWVFGAADKPRGRCIRVKMGLRNWGPNAVTFGVEKFHKFWNKFGHLMKNLSLEECTLHWGDPPSLPCILFLKTPNLESLSLNNTVSKNGYGDSFLRFDDYKLTSLYTIPYHKKLKTFTCDGGEIPMGKDVLGCLPKIETFRISK